MPEKFDFSKIEDQKEFENLPQEEKDKIVGEAQEDVSSRNLDELINNTSSLEDIEKLVDKDFKITVQDLILINEIGERQRQSSKNKHYDYSVEATTFLVYLITQLKNRLIPEEDTDFFEASIKPVQSHFFINEIAEGEKIEENYRKIINILSNIKKSQSLDELNTIVYETFKYFQALHADAERKIDDQKIRLEIMHNFGNGFSQVFQMYQDAIK